VQENQRGDPRGAGEVGAERKVIMPSPGGP
jgi:hypothetical protein